METTHDNHYVPCQYLKRWAKDGQMSITEFGHTEHWYPITKFLCGKSDLLNLLDFKMICTRFE